MAHSKTRKNRKKYTAFIIEPRKHKALEFVLKNFLRNLSNEWSFIIFHGNLNKEYVQNIVDTKLSKYKNRITLKSIHKDNIGTSEYSKLLTTKSFYEQIPTEIFLIFQTDSMIIPKNKDNILQFLDYDYVGAPVFFRDVGNGGLSLRRKSKMLEILDKVPYMRIPFIKSSHIIDYEDTYFGLSFHYNLLASLISDISIKKPSAEEAELFSSECYINSKSFGIHAPWKYYSMKKLKSVYPNIEKLKSLQGVEE
jgi:hypothetical protein